MSNRTLVIWNGNAGTSEKAVALRARLDDSTLVELREPSDRREAVQMVRDAVQNGTQLVIAAGGDGTVSSVVNGLCGNGHTAVMGILPLGTGNDLCRTLGIPLDPMEASDLLWPAVQRVGGRTQDRKPVPQPPMRHLDVVKAMVADRTIYFANAASGGNAGDISRYVTSEMKQRWGPWCYLRGAVSMLTALNDYETVVSIDGGPSETLRTWAMTIANGRTVGGGIEVAPQADVADGLMDVVLILASSPVEAVITTTNFLMGNFLEDERVVFRKAKVLTLRCEPDAKFVADGEPLPHGPMTFRVQPKALQVIAPPEEEKLSTGKLTPG